MQKSNGTGAKSPQFQRQLKQSRLSFPAHSHVPAMNCTRPYVSLALGGPFSMKSLGSTSKCGRLVPGTTFGDKAQTTKPGISKIGALEN